MKKQEIITSTINLIKREAYQARVQEELYGFGFETSMMQYYKNTSCGKAFGAMQVLSLMTGKPADDIYEAAVEEATQDIRKVDNSNYDNMIIRLLDLAGFNGEEYYKVATK